MTVTDKSRTINFGHATGSLWPPGVNSVPIVTTYKRSGYQHTISEGHQVSLLGHTDRDIGGSFNTVKDEYVGGGQEMFLNRPTVPAGYRYRGVQAVKSSFNGGDFPVAISSSEEELDAMGTTAIARVEPTDPIFPSTTFLGEIFFSGGLPRIGGADVLKRNIKRYRSLGGEYLNVEFGWKPFVSDMKKYRDAATNSANVLREYERQSGANVRRRYAFPVTTESVTVDMGTAYPSPTLPTALYLSGHGAGPLHYTDTSYIRQWFSGCFTYYLNLGNTGFDKMERAHQEAQKLYGVDITPEVLWDVTPWTWMADWFGNTGDVLHNIGAMLNEGLVIKWGYMMEESIVSRTWTLSDFYYLSEPYPHTFTQTFRNVRKTRRPATPFGFGYDMDTLTPSRVAILAALGISRA